jgi:hypothetical protein
MNAKTLLLAMASVALLEAAPLAYGACSGPNCPVKVTITSGCDSVAADPDQLHVAKGKTVTIVWQTDQSSDWEFTDQGIVFKNLQAAWPVFSQPTHKGKVFTWKDRNQAAAQFPYSIEVKNTKTGQICRKDPTVVNE